MADREVTWPHNGGVIELAGGEKGRYTGVCTITGKHRVQTFKYRGKPVDPPTSSDQYRDYAYTTWLLTAGGICRCDGKPGDFDFVRIVEMPKSTPSSMEDRHVG